MDRRLRDTYRRFPITSTYGVGSFVYTLFCIDNMTGNQVRHDIHANSLNEALEYSKQLLNTGASFNILDDTSLEVYFTSYPSYLSYLFI